MLLRSIPVCVSVSTSYMFTPFSIIFVQNVCMLENADAQYLCVVRLRETPNAKTLCVRECLTVCSARVCGRGFAAHLYVVFTALWLVNSPVIPAPPAVCSSCSK